MSLAFKAATFYGLPTINCEAALMQLLCARFQPTDAAGEDEFYADADFVWDFYNEVINQQDSLYHDDDYRYVLSGLCA